MHLLLSHASMRPRAAAASLLPILSSVPLLAERDPRAALARAAEGDEQVQAGRPRASMPLIHVPSLSRMRDLVSERCLCPSYGFVRRTCGMRTTAAARTRRVRSPRQPRAPPSLCERGPPTPPRRLTVPDMGVRLEADGCAIPSRAHVKVWEPHSQGAWRGAIRHRGPGSRESIARTATLRRV